MKIRSISFKNFGSYGNKMQNITFDDQEGNFFLVVGSNGAGKSTISDVIKFGLYGKVDSKNLRDIPNRFNGNAHVKIVVEKNPTTLVTIERGLAPSVFRLFINGVEYDQAGKKNMQEFLEEEILGIPYYVFNNMISLSINDFKSFISMRVHDKRMIIDRLFGLEIIGAVKWKVRYQIKLLKEQAESIVTEISVLERTIQKSNEELDTLNEKLKIAGEERKGELLESLNKLNSFIEKAQDNLSQIENKDRDLSESLDSWNKSTSKLEWECRHRSEKIDLYEKGKCPTCENDLTTDYYQGILQEYQKQNLDAKDEIDSIKKTQIELQEKRKSLKALYDETNRKKITAKAKIDGIRSEITKMDSSNSTDEQTSSLKNIIEDSQKKQEEAKARKDVEERKANFYKIVEDIFGDKGIKLLALKRILPLLNSEIKRVLTDLNMDYRVTFNEEFEADIQHLGFKVAPEQLSTGERKKVDFAALIALIRMMKMKITMMTETYGEKLNGNI